MATLFLTEEEVKQLATLPLAISAVKEAHILLATGLAVDMPRVRTKTAKSTLHILQGALPTHNILGYKAYTSSKSSNRFLVHLYNSETGENIAVIAAKQLGILRTAAASAVASSLFANAKSEILTVFGAGNQALEHILAQCLFLPNLHEIRVIARDLVKLESFCEKVAKDTQIKVIPFSLDKTAQALKDSLVIGTVTNSSLPLFAAENLEDGVHINAVGSNSLIRQELSEAVIKKMQRIIVDSRVTALNEAGDLFSSLEKGRLFPNQLEELGDVLCGKISGRKSLSENSLFESQGLAVQDLMLAEKIYQLALNKNLGDLRN